MQGNTRSRVGLTPVGRRGVLDALELMFDQPVGVGGDGSVVGMSQVLVGAGGRTGEQVQVERGAQGPVRFWRGQGRYEVGELLDHRVETAPWWESGVGGGATAEPVAPWQVWRVEAVRAGRSRTSFAGVFDLSWEPGDDRWLLVRVHD